jgi:hypothetical protein
LAESLRYEIEETKGADALSILIEFNDYGRMIDMRRISHDEWGRNAIDRVEKWVIAKGVQRFVPGFLERRKLKSPPVNVINQIAWGILASRSGGKFRRRPWWNKAQSGGISDLYNQVSASLPRAAASEIAKGLGKKDRFSPQEYAKRRGRE